MVYIKMISITIDTWLVVFFAIIIVWELIWKGVALWTAGRNNQLEWFLLILVLITVGILPLIYLIWFVKSKNPRREGILIKDIALRNPEFFKKKVSKKKVKKKR
jgi:hypothetical protein